MIAIFPKATSIRDSTGEMISVGSTVVFEPRGYYVFGSDGITEPGDTGHILRIEEEPNAKYTCYVHFPRVAKEREKQGLKRKSFLAHPMELVRQDLDLCSRYNIIIHGITGE